MFRTQVFVWNSPKTTLESSVLVISFVSAWEWIIYWFLLTLEDISKLVSPDFEAISKLKYICMGQFSHCCYKTLVTHSGETELFKQKGTHSVLPFHSSRAVSLLDGGTYDKVGHSLSVCWPPCSHLWKHLTDIPQEIICFANLLSVS